MAATPPKKQNKASKSLLESADVPIQFGVPSEPSILAKPSAASTSATNDMSGDAASLPELADASEAVVEVVAASPVESAAAEQSLSTISAAIVPVALETPAAELPTGEPQTTDPILEPCPETSISKKGFSMDETSSKMNDTMTNAAATMSGATEAMHNAAGEMQARGTAMFGDMNTRTKSAVERGTKAVEELVEFQKGNMEAMMSSGRVAANGAQEIAKYSAEYGRSTIEKANATARQFATVKSPAEFFQLQGEIAKQTLDAMVAEGAKFTESYMKLMGEVAQPLSNRASVAVDKVKTIVGTQN